MKKKLKTYEVVRTVKYSMLTEGYSVKDVLTNSRMCQVALRPLDAYWDRHELKPTITEVEDNESC
jgi:hypothetical protein